MGPLPGEAYRKYSFKPRARDLTPAQEAMTPWFEARGFRVDGSLWVIVWPCRSGYDFTDLEFYPVRRHANDAGWLAIIGHHTSGENPRLHIGQCDTIEDVERIYQAIRLTNGYEGPEADPAAVSVPAPQEPTSEQDVIKEMRAYAATGVRSAVCDRIGLWAERLALAASSVQAPAPATKRIDFLYTFPKTETVLRAMTANGDRSGVTMLSKTWLKELRAAFDEDKTLLAAARVPPAPTPKEHE